MPEPITKLSAKFCKNLKGIFSDIDDTMSLHGKIPAETYKALWQAKEAGLRVIPVTGRPAGWVDHIARMWPVDAVVGENGAFYFFLDGTHGRDGKLVQRFVQNEKTREQNRDKLWDLFEKIRVKVPQLTLASDQGYRKIDIAIDYCEDVSRLSDRAIAEIMEHYERGGAQVKLSSIHINAWFGDHDKYSCCRLLMKELFQEQIDEEKDRYLYFGDSPNDEPFFKEFPYTVGVANVEAFLPMMQHKPRFITKKPGGHGFAEALRHILKNRK